MKNNTFDLDDYLSQLQSVKKMGNLTDMIWMIPGIGNKMKGMDLTVDEKQLDRTKAIIQSMTPRERAHPEILNASRRKRIAAGSGTTVQDVNRLLNQFNQAKDLMKKMSSGKRKLPFGF